MNTQNNKHFYIQMVVIFFLYSSAKGIQFNAHTLTMLGVGSGLTLFGLHKTLPSISRKFPFLATKKAFISVGLASIGGYALFTYIKKKKMEAEKKKLDKQPPFDIVLIASRIPIENKPLNYSVLALLLCQRLKKDFELQNAVNAAVIKKDQKLYEKDISMISKFKVHIIPHEDNLKSIMIEKQLNTPHFILFTLNNSNEEIKKFREYLFKQNDDVSFQYILNKKNDQNDPFIHYLFSIAPPKIDEFLSKNAVKKDSKESLEAQIDKFKDSLNYAVSTSSSEFKETEDSHGEVKKKK